MLAAGVEIAPKKTSFASTGRPSTAYHELELAAMDLLSIIRASKDGANKDLKKMAAQLRALQRNGRTPERAQCLDRRAVPFGWTVRCVSPGLPGRGRGSPKRKEER